MTIPQEDIRQIQIGSDKLTYHFLSTSTTFSNSVVWSPSSGKRTNIRTILVNSSVAQPIDLYDGTNQIMRLNIDANSGLALNFSPPLRSSSTDAYLFITAETTGETMILVNGYEE